MCMCVFISPFIHLFRHYVKWAEALHACMLSHLVKTLSHLVLARTMRTTKKQNSHSLVLRQSVIRFQTETRGLARREIWSIFPSVPKLNGYIIKRNKFAFLPPPPLFNEGQLFKQKNLLSSLKVGAI